MDQTTVKKLTWNVQDRMPLAFLYAEWAPNLAVLKDTLLVGDVLLDENMSTPEGGYRHAWYKIVSLEPHLMAEHYPDMKAFILRELPSGEWGWAYVGRGSLRRSELRVVGAEWNWWVSPAGEKFPTGKESHDESAISIAQGYYGIPDDKLDAEYPRAMWLLFKGWLRVSENNNLNIGVPGIPDNLIEYVTTRPKRTHIEIERFIFRPYQGAGRVTYFGTPQHVYSGPAGQFLEQGVVASLKLTWQIEPLPEYLGDYARAGNKRDLNIPIGTILLAGTKDVPRPDKPTHRYEVVWSWPLVIQQQEEHSLWRWDEGEGWVRIMLSELSELRQQAQGPDATASLKLAWDVEPLHAGDIVTFQPGGDDLMREINIFPEDEYVQEIEPDFRHVVVNINSTSSDWQAYKRDDHPADAWVPDFGPGEVRIKPERKLGGPSSGWTIPLSHWDRYLRKLDS